MNEKEKDNSDLITVLNCILQYEKITDFKRLFLSTPDGINLQIFLDFFRESIDHEVLSRIFHRISTNNTITWDQFETFLNVNLQEENTKKIHIVSFTNRLFLNRESILKILTLETAENCCFLIVGKFGGIRVFSTDFQLLHQYQVFLRRTKRSDWVTDAIFCPDVRYFVVTTSVRNLIIYDAAHLKHLALWHILGLPNIVQGLGYKSFPNPMLILGDDGGCVLGLGFKKNQFYDWLPCEKKSFFWLELRKLKSYISIRKFHFKGNSIGQILSDGQNQCVVLEKNGTKVRFSKKKILQMDQAVSYIAQSTFLNLIAVGTTSGTVSVWNLTYLVLQDDLKSDTHFGPITGLLFLDQHQILISTSANGVLNIWDLEGATCTCQVELSGGYGSYGLYKGSGPRPVLVTCPNQVYALRIGGLPLDSSQLPPPPLQNSVLIPNTWQMIENLDISVKSDFVTKQNSNLIDFINNVEFPRCLDQLIHEKIAQIETRKLLMNKYVVRNTPFLGLDLVHLDEENALENVEKPLEGRAAQIYEKIVKILEKATMKNRIFSKFTIEDNRTNSSFGRRSSLSSINDFLNNN